MTDVTRDFGTVRALDGLSLSVSAGVVFGFLGPNGAGKTTTIRMLLGLVEPSSGSAEVFGFDTSSHADTIRGKTGALLEHTGLYERLSAEENMEFYARIWQMDEAARRERIGYLLDHFGLGDRRSDRVGTWSRGMKQKLAVARTLIHHPELVFLDEPTAGLDPVASAALREDITRLAKDEAVTVFLTTHNLSEAEKVCDLVGVINRGQLIATGRPDDLIGGDGAAPYRISGAGLNNRLLTEILSMENISEARLEEDDLIIGTGEQQSLNPLISALINRGVEIREITRERAGLEETFLKLVEEGNSHADQ